jgi:hypothetical protein
MTFGSKCTGLTDPGPNGGQNVSICHFAARKFSPNSRDGVLHNLKSLLSEPGYPYNRNPWLSRRKKLRYAEDASALDKDGKPIRKHWYLDFNRRREITRAQTAKDLLMVDVSHATPLTAQEALLPYSFDVSDLVNGDWVNVNFRGTIGISKTLYYIQDGQRHACPDFETFVGKYMCWRGRVWTTMSVPACCGYYAMCYMCLNPPLPLPAIPGSHGRRHG